MKYYVLKKEQFIPRPLKEVFAFYERPENLARITPPWLGFRIVTPSPIVMRQGALFEYTIRVMGTRLRWISVISAYEPPFKFIDEQIKGPYAYWHHTHTFAEAKDGTMVGDEVRYALPFGPLGSLAQRIAVRRQLEKVFTYRAEVCKSIFG